MLNLSSTAGLLRTDSTPIGKFQPKHQLETSHGLLKITIVLQVTISSPPKTYLVPTTHLATITVQMNYYYTSSRRLEGVTEPSLYEEGSRVEASKDLLRLYDAGVPFFTKESIRDVQRQLQKSSPGDKLRIKGVNGEVVVWDIETGERKKYGEGTSSAREFVLYVFFFIFNPSCCLFDFDIIIILGG